MLAHGALSLPLPAFRFSSRLAEEWDTLLGIVDLLNEVLRVCVASLVRTE